MISVRIECSDVVEHGCVALGGTYSFVSLRCHREG